MTKTAEMIDFLEALPEEDQNLAYELIRRLVLAWDPDFVKLTPNERRELNRIKATLDEGMVSHDEIDWS